MGNADATGGTVEDEVSSDRWVINKKFEIIKKIQIDSNQSWS